MTDVPRDVHTVLVDSALARTEVLDAVRVDAARVDGADLVDAAPSADALARAIIEEAVRVSITHMHAQVRDSADSIRAEAKEIRTADPATIKSVTSQEIAARKVEKMRGADG